MSTQSNTISGPLSDRELAFWDDYGFLALKGFFQPDELASFRHDVDNFLVNRVAQGGRVTIDLLEGPDQGRHLIRDRTDADLSQPYKINDLFLEFDSCRALCLHERLKPILAQLLAGEPLVINSLTFGKGSQQHHHFDTYYMPPPKENAMVVSSICLEPQTPTAGPLSYYPGSHKVPAYRFSHGGLHAVPDELPQATDYITQEIESRGLPRQEFVGDTGDLFIWHAQLYHGAAKITDPSRTRRTLVTHYWRSQDVEPDLVADSAFGKHLKRDHPAISD